MSQILTPSDYNYVMRVYSELIAAERGSSASANCSISIGTISGTLNSNCNVLISNMCSSSSSLQLLDIAINKAVLLRDSVSKNLTEEYNNLRSSCVSQATIINSISVHHIELGVCSPDRPIFLAFVNSGESISNCVVSGLLKYTTVQTSANKDSSAMTSNFVYICISVALVGFIGFSLILYGISSRSKLVVYRAKNY